MRACRKFGRHLRSLAYFQLVDLHSHPNASDGTCSRAELLYEANGLDGRTRGNTDDDTFAGYHLVRSHAGLFGPKRFVRGHIEERLHIRTRFLCETSPRKFHAFAITADPSGGLSI